MTEVTREDIHKFLNGTNEQEHIIKVECSNDSDTVDVIYIDKNGIKKIQKDKLYPFCWAKQSVGRAMFNGDRDRTKRELNKHNIAVKGLRINDSDGNVHERMSGGFRNLFYATKPMSYTEFLNFFKSAGTPVYSDNETDDKQFLIVAPVEQYMIMTGKRMFKGYDNYDDLLRMQWDLETEGLDPYNCAISQIGIRTNKGFEKILTIEGTGEEKRENEIRAILNFFSIIRDVKPDIISGHNSENFDWNFIKVRLEINNFDMKEISKQYLPDGVFKKDRKAVLKLGGEMEYYNPTVMWGFNLTDSLFAVRRAQAIDSSMKKADLKYVTKYSKINKPNRVYVPGKIIDETWSDTGLNYAFNNNNGEWFKINTSSEFEGQPRYIIDENNKTVYDNKTKTTYDIVSGRYIVERYLLDDLWETDKVECRYNESNFLVGKMLPVSFERMCTMGTAAIWKYIMMAWTHEHNLGIPSLINSRKFTGGLSRLLSVGYNPRVVKLDYNSLYPSIILTYGIKSPIDIMGAMSAMLEYILSQREYYKELKAKWGAKASELKNYLKEHPELSDEEKENVKKEIDNANLLKAKNDKLQLPLKITGNGFFGSYGSGSVFPWSDIVCAEETTCIGRQALRLMISHFSNIAKTMHSEVCKSSDDLNDDDIVVIKFDDTDEIMEVKVSEIENETIQGSFKIKTENGWQAI